MSKGSWHRPSQVSRDVRDKTYEKLFGKFEINKNYINKDETIPEKDTPIPEKDITD